MPNHPRAAAAVLAAFMLVSCGSRAPTAVENGTGETVNEAPENAGAAPGPVNSSEGPGAEPVPPPDAVSHPEGYLPDAADPPAPSTPESPPTSNDPPPATEDEYIRNQQAGR